MHTLTIQIKDNKALKAIHSLQEKNSLQIVEDIKTDTPALEGNPISIAAFKNWVGAAETTPSVTLKSAKSQWLKKRALLSKLIR